MNPFRHLLPYYTEQRIRDVLLDGIADIDIRREALSVEGIQSRSTNEIIHFVETRETARDANQAPDVLSNLSIFKARLEKWIPDCKCRLCQTYISDIGFVNITE